MFTLSRPTSANDGTLALSEREYVSGDKRIGEFTYALTVKTELE